MNTVQDVEKYAEELMKKDDNDLYKLQVKAWEQISKYRLGINVNVEPFNPFAIPALTIMYRVQIGKIDVLDIGDGTIEYAIKVLQDNYYV